MDLGNLLHIINVSLYLHMNEDEYVSEKFHVEEDE